MFPKPDSYLVTWGDNPSCTATRRFQDRNEAVEFWSTIRDYDVALFEEVRRVKRPQVRR